MYGSVISKAGSRKALSKTSAGIRVRSVIGVNRDKFEDRREALRDNVNVVVSSGTQWFFNVVDT